MNVTARRVLVASSRGFGRRRPGAPAARVGPGPMPSPPPPPVFSHTGTTAPRLASSSSTPPPPADGRAQHGAFEEQLRELREEREILFGAGGSDGACQADDPQFVGDESLAPLHRESAGGGPGGDGSVDELERLHEARASMYGFTEEEKSAWSAAGPGHSHSAELIEMVQRARDEQDLELQKLPPPAAPGPVSPQPFTHLAPGGGSVSMVDVGAKTVTARFAAARSRVVFPPEIMDAFSAVGGNGSEELVGPKGPIFSTARVAGIMAAKRTSELIPLCHPLPLDRVNVDVRMEGNVAVVDCECRVTHRTGVEMEALVGASVAALTIYDMVKAVSHRVKIVDTVLLRKSGGKRHVDAEADQTPS